MEKKEKIVKAETNLHHSLQNLVSAQNNFNNPLNYELQKTDLRKVNSLSDFSTSKTQQSTKKERSTGSLQDISHKKRSLNQLYKSQSVSSSRRDLQKKLVKNSSSDKFKQSGPVIARSYGSLSKSSSSIARLSNPTESYKKKVEAVQERQSQLQKEAQLQKHKPSDHGSRNFIANAEGKKQVRISGLNAKAVNILYSVDLTPEEEARNATYIASSKGDLRELSHSGEEKIAKFTYPA